jgi:hypothetical protein
MNQTGRLMVATLAVCGFASGAIARVVPLPVRVAGHQTLIAADTPAICGRE